MNFSAALFVGGRSSRMGRDKASLEIEGIPLWQRQLQTLRSLGPSEIFLSAPTQPAWIREDMEFVADANPRSGPLAGLVAVLRRCENEHMLALAIDLPNMTTAFLKHLLATCPDDGGVVPKRIGAALFEPLAAIYPASCLALAENCLNSGEYSLQQLISRAVKAALMVVREVTRAEESLFLNLNTPADLAAIEKK